MTQLAAARLNAGLDEEPEAKINPIGVIKTSAMSLRNDLDPRVLLTIEEEQEILPEFSGWYDDDSNNNIVYDEDAVEDILEPVI